MKQHRLLRYALFATAGMNSFGALLFMPPLQQMRSWFGLPLNVHPLYLWIISAWILLFGCAYFYMALTKKFERTLLAIGAGGKLSFFLLLLGYYFYGEVTLLTVLSGSSDLIFAMIFIIWLLSTWHNPIATELKSV